MREKRGSPRHCSKSLDAQTSAHLQTKKACIFTCGGGNNDDPYFFCGGDSLAAAQALPTITCGTKTQGRDDEL